LKNGSQGEHLGTIEKWFPNVETERWPRKRRSSGYVDTVL
jgi:hypothetical protein